MTVLSRDPSALQNLPQGVKFTKVDYSSEDSIVAALKDQDVAVATLGLTAIPTQDKIIDAAIKAEVKRFIPSDWGSITTDPKARGLPINKPLIQVQDYLEKKAAEGKIEWTILSVGAFLDYVINFPFVLDLASKSIQLYDDGQHPFSSTSVHSVGKAIAGSLKNPDATKNRNLFINDIVLTQAKVLELAKKHSAPGTQWSETKVDATKDFEQALANLEKNPTDPTLTFLLLKAALFSGKFRAAYPKVDNEIVGLPLFTDEEFENKLAAKVKST